jgi:hypothetical protein
MLLQMPQSRTKYIDWLLHYLFILCILACFFDTLYCGSFICILHHLFIQHIVICADYFIDVWQDGALPTPGVGV